MRWTAYNNAVEDYQGELVDKKAVQDRIVALLRDARPDHDPNDEPWATIHALAATLISAATPTSFPGQEFAQP